MSRVLITGGTGFIASHCIELLLTRGYTVTTTVRSSDKGERVLKAFSHHPSKLNYVIVKDVAPEDAFNEAVKSTPGFDAVIHTTSPFFYNVKDAVKDMLEPAIVGTTNILQAIKDHAPSVKRVVLLSSFAAMRNETNPPEVYDESSWNPVTYEQAATDAKKTYQGSKALSEKAAWEFMEKEKPGFDLVSINPSMVFGPIAYHLGKGEEESVNTSNSRIVHMMQGKMKEKLEPTGFYSWVDVRDVAYAHVRALEVPEAGGKRFFVIAGYHTNAEVAKVVAAQSLELKEKLPANLDLESDIPGPDERYKFSNKQSKDVLGVTYRSFDECIADTVQSLQKIGA